MISSAGRWVVDEVKIERSGTSITVGAPRSCSATSASARLAQPRSGSGAPRCTSTYTAPRGARRRLADVHELGVLLVFDVEVDGVANRDALGRRRWRGGRPRLRERVGAAGDQQEREEQGERQDAAVHVAADRGPLRAERETKNGHEGRLGRPDPDAKSACWRGRLDGIRAYRKMRITVARQPRTLTGFPVVRPTWLSKGRLNATVSGVNEPVGHYRAAYSASPPDG